MVPKPAEFAAHIASDTCSYTVPFRVERQISGLLTDIGAYQPELHYITVVESIVSTVAIEIMVSERVDGFSVWFLYRERRMTSWRRWQNMVVRSGWHEMMTLQ